MTPLFWVRTTPFVTKQMPVRLLKKIDESFFFSKDVSQGFAAIWVVSCSVQIFTLVHLCQLFALLLGPCSGEEETVSERHLVSVLLCLFLTATLCPALNP